MKTKTPKFMLIYKCESCGFDSGFTEQSTEIKCYYCSEESRMTLVSKEVLTREVMAKRLKVVTDRLFSHLQADYESVRSEPGNVLEDPGPDPDEVKALLDKAREFKEEIENLSEKELKSKT